MSAEYDEPLRIELLQLATLLLKYLQNDLVHHRKELIKFGWNHLKREDNSSKQWAFVNVCHFLEAYQAPEKIILQVFLEPLGLDILLIWWMPAIITSFLDHDVPLTLSMVFYKHVCST